MARQAKTATRKTTTMNISDAWAQAATALAEEIKYGHLLARQLRIHLGQALASLESISQAALEMIDEVEADTPLIEIHRRFMDLANQAALSMTGHVWMVTPHE